MMGSSKIRIQVQIILFSLLGTLALGIAISLVAVRSSGESLLEARKEQMSSIREGAKEQIQAYMDFMGKLLISLASDHTSKAALSEFEEAFEWISDEVEVDEAEIDKLLEGFYESNYLSKINYAVPGGGKPRDISNYLPGTLNGKIAQYLYIVLNPYSSGEKNKLLYPDGFDRAIYTKVHSKYHLALSAFLSNFHLYDVFLVDLAGEVVYSNFKEMDYATNLISGPYKDTGLARTFRNALNLQEGQIAFDDFAPYEPSYNLAAAFIGTPVMINGQKAGALIFQLPINRINQIMTFNGRYEQVGLGKTGESYLVGSDQLMRNDCRFVSQLDHPLVRSLGTTIGILEVNTKSVSEALSGRSGTMEVTNYRNVPVISSYTTANVFDKRWAVIADMELNEALMERSRLTRNILFMTGLLISVCIGLSVFFIRRIVARPLSDIIDKVKDLSEKGADLTHKIQVRSQDEIGMLAGYFNTFIASLREQMIKIGESSEILSGAVQDLSVSSKEVESTSNSQAAAVKEVVSAMEDSDRLSRSVAGRSTEVVRIAEQTRENVGKGFSITRSSIGKMNEIRVSNDGVISGIRSLGNQIRSIWEIVEIINAVADQTKIIAFNAELEASAAGEAGKNFEIVANEIRRLANNTMASTKEIKARIVEIQHASDNLILVSEQGTRRITEGWKLSENLEEVFREVLSSSETSAESAHKIAESISQQARAFEQVLLTLRQISEGIDNFVLSTRATTEASETLRVMAEDLREIVSKYAV